MTPGTAHRWQRRTAAEFASAKAMGALARRLQSVDPSASRWSAALTRAAADEVRHGELCQELLTGQAVEPPAKGPEPHLPHTVSGDLHLALMEHVAFLLVAGETIAAELLTRAADRATAPGVATLLTTIARDEAHHSALGWALLDHLDRRLTDTQRGEVAMAIPTQVIRAAVAARGLGPIEADGSAWGLLSGEEASTLARSIVTRQVIPKLQARGLWNPVVQRNS